MLTSVRSRSDPAHPQAIDSLRCLEETSGHPQFDVTASLGEILKTKFIQDLQDLSTGEDTQF